MNEVQKSQFWEQVNNLEHLASTLNNCQSIISICAERQCDAESGALWLVADVLSEKENKLDQIIQNLLAISRELNKPIKKAKK